jgi:hypothetical protein
MDELTTILTSRELLYQRASVVVDTSGQTVAQSLERLIGVMSRRDMT